MSVLVSSPTGAVSPANAARLGAEMSNGTKIALVQAPGSGALPHYFTSSDGLAWTDGGQLPATPTTGPDTTHVPAYIPMSRVVHCGSYTMGGVEKLVLWFTTDTGADVNVLNHALIGYYEAAWDGVSAFSGSHGGYLDTFQDSGNTTGNTVAAMAWDGTNWGVTVFDRHAHQLSTVLLAPGIWKPVVVGTVGGASLIWGFGSGDIDALDVAYIPGGIVTLISDLYRGAITLLPAAISSLTVTQTIGSLETVSGGNTGPVACLPDGSGHVDLFYLSGSGTVLEYVKRTGTGAYSTVTDIGPVDPSEPAMSCLRDTTTADLWVFWTSATNFSEGEVWYRFQHAGSWTSAAVLAGGDASGSIRPHVNDSSAGVLNVLFQKGTASPWDLYYQAVGAGAAPGAPINLTTGDILGLTPQLSYTEARAYPADPQQFRQIQIADLAAVVFYDTGQVASSSDAFTMPGGSGLAYGVASQWRVRDWDLFSNAGIGTVGPWSSWAIITPVRAGVPVLTDIISGGATSSTLIEGPLIQADIGWTHPDGHGASAVQLTVYRSDRITPIGSSPVYGPAIASGGAFTTPAWDIPLSDGTTVYVVVSITDAVTGLVSSSAPALYTVSYVGPSAPTGVSVTMDPVAGTATLGWTNPAGAVSADAEFQGVDGVWQVGSQDTLSTSYPFHPGPEIPHSYRVRVRDASGLYSAYETLTDEVLGMRAGLFGVLVTDVVTGETAFLGVVDDESALSFDNKEDAISWVPPGCALPKDSLGLMEYREGNFKFKVMAATPDTGGVIIYGRDIIATLDRMRHAKHILRYRDPHGVMLYCKLYNLRPDFYASIHYKVAFTLRECFPPPVPFL